MLIDGLKMWNASLVFSVNQILKIRNGLSQSCLDLA